MTRDSSSDSLTNMLGNLVAAGPSPRTNVLALLDGYTNSTVYSGTMLYDVMRGQAVAIMTTLDTTLTVPGELDMGDGHTLAGFQLGALPLSSSPHIAGNCRSRWRLGAQH
jgi:hypothetical protein